jgi:hypothetical protein
MPTGPNAAFLCRQIALSEIHGDNIEELEHGMVVRSNGHWLVLWDLAAAPTIELIIQSALKNAEAEGATLCGGLLLLSPDEEQQPAVKEITEALFVYGLTEPPEHSGYPDQVQVLARPEFPKAHSGFSVTHQTGSTTGGKLVANLGQGSREMLGPFFGMTAADFEIDNSAGCVGGEGSTEVLHAANGVCRRLLAIRPGGGEACLGLTIKGISEQCSERGELLFTCWSSRKGTLRYALSELGFETQLIVRFHLAE